jgi:hypothetical protein
MTDDETNAVLALAKVKVGRDVGASRFIAELAWDLKVHPYVSISRRQAEFLWKLVRRYRRYMQAELVEVACHETSHQIGVS